MCDRHDLGVALGDNGQGEARIERGLRRLGMAGRDEPRAGDDYEPNIFLYDNYPGGIGLSEPLYRLHDRLLRESRALIAACPCRDGCPSCVGPAGEIGSRGKEVALALLDAILRAACRGSTGPTLPSRSAEARDRKLSAGSLPCPRPRSTTSCSGCAARPSSARPPPAGVAGRLERSLLGAEAEDGISLRERLQRLVSAAACATSRGTWRSGRRRVAARRRRGLAATRRLGRRARPSRSWSRASASRTSAASSSSWRTTSTSSRSTATCRSPASARCAPAPSAILTAEPGLDAFDLRAAVFLDTETTGLAGGAGTAAFLDRRRLRRGRPLPGAPVLHARLPRGRRRCSHALADDLARFERIVTFNGKMFDLPLLEARYRLNRARFPLSGRAPLRPAASRAAALEGAPRVVPAAVARGAASSACAAGATSPASRSPRSTSTTSAAATRGPCAKVFDHNRARHRVPGRPRDPGLPVGRGGPGRGPARRAEPGPRPRAGPALRALRGEQYRRAVGPRQGAPAQRRLFCGWPPGRSAPAISSERRGSVAAGGRGGGAVWPAASWPCTTSTAPAISMRPWPRSTGPSTSSYGRRSSPQSRRMARGLLAGAARIQRLVAQAAGGPLAESPSSGTPQPPER